jgi:Uma2 family endonuclease
MADTTPQVKLFTEGELLNMDSQDEKFEVINGELVPMASVGVEHAAISANLVVIFKPFVRKHGLGHFFGDSLMYVLKKNGDVVILSRSPDASFVRKGRFPKDFDMKRFFPGAPDLAIEIVSPSESANSIIEKTRDYFSEGTEEVWVIYPKFRTLHRYHRDDPDNPRVFHEDDTLKPESLFPGMQFPIAECFVMDVPEDN